MRSEEREKRKRSIYIIVFFFFFACMMRSELPSNISFLSMAFSFLFVATSACTHCFEWWIINRLSIKCRNIFTISRQYNASSSVMSFSLCMSGRVRLRVRRVTIIATPYSILFSESALTVLLAETYNNIPALYKTHLPLFYFLLSSQNHVCGAERMEENDGELRYEQQMQDPLSLFLCAHDALVNASLYLSMDAAQLLPLQVSLICLINSSALLSLLLYMAF